MDQCNENVIMHSILCVKLEPSDEDEDCTQNLDPLEPGSNVHTKLEVLQDFKTEIESDSSDQAMNKLIQEDILKNDLSDTEMKIEEINIKTEYIDDEASASDHLLNSRGIIEGNSSSEQTEHGCVAIQKQADEIDTKYEFLTHSCKPQLSDVINEEPDDGNALNATSPGTKVVHTDQKAHVCDICKKGFNYRSDLVRHKRVHTGQKPYVCDICKKGFSSSSYLITHNRIHTSQKPYICDVCQKAFSNSPDLARHKRTHTGHRPYVCKICAKGFCQSSHLVAHIRTHTGQKPYVCDICTKGFSTTSDLVKHKRIHTGQKLFICDICNKGFAHSSTLIRHKRIHTGQKPYSCDICKRVFSDSSNLVAHKRSHAVGC